MIIGMTSDEHAKKEIGGPGAHSRVHRSMKGADRLLVAFDVLVAGPIFVQARKLELGVKFEVGQSLSESFKRAATENSIAACEPGIHEMIVECRQRGQELFLAHSVQETEEAVEHGARLLHLIFSCLERFPITLDIRIRKNPLQGLAICAALY
jgi:hypothetical protein